MGKSTLIQIESIGRNIEALVGTEIREQVLAGTEGIKESTKPEKIAAIMQGVVARMDVLVSEADRQQILLNCGYQCISHNQTP